MSGHVSTLYLGLFFKRVRREPSGCWQWTSSVGKNGYGLIRLDRHTWSAHRFTYEHFVGPVPAGFHIDHLCRNRTCVNPAHMEAVTPRENLLRGDTIPARNSKKTACIHGHAYTPENTVRRKKCGSRECRTCMVARDAGRDRNTKPVQMAGSVQ